MQPYLLKNVHLVPSNVALQVAEKLNPTAFYGTDNKYNNSPFKSSLSGQNTISSQFTINDSRGLPAIYIFNYSNNAGFVFVSADSGLRPILAYIEQGSFKKDTVPGGVIKWANKTINNIEICRQGLHRDTLGEAKAAWEGFYMKQQPTVAQLKKLAGKSGVIINKQPPAPPTDYNCGTAPFPSYQLLSSSVSNYGPLLPITWGQGSSYNDLCPTVGASCGDDGHAWTGCVATAVTQVVRFWQPSNSYAYNYSSMPTTFGNTEVARLMKDAGLPSNLNMDYSDCSGSSTSASNVPTALNHFGLTGTYSSSYSMGYADVDLAVGRPVILGGCNDETNAFLGIWYRYENCHCWVLDGLQYQTTDVCQFGYETISKGLIAYHMNWGWHELYSTSGTSGINPDYNGWYAIDNWNIPGAGDNFQYANDMTTSIHI